jgi:hypothetical protein
VGCANGEIAAALLDLGVDAWGLDASVEGREWRLLPSERYVTADLRDLISLKDKFDLAICFEVLTVMPKEHHAIAILNISRMSDMVLCNGIPEIPGFRENLMLMHQIQDRLSFWRHKQAIKSIYQTGRVFKRIKGKES